LIQLHGSAEVAAAGVRTVMIFAKSLHGVSHSKIEYTKQEHLESLNDCAGRERETKWEMPGNMKATGKLRHKDPTHEVLSI
jgi:hypothetical protein